MVSQEQGGTNRGWSQCRLEAEVQSWENQQPELCPASIFLSHKGDSLESGTIRNRCSSTRRVLYIQLKNKVSKDGEAGLDEFELNDYILIATFTSAVDAFGTTVKFDEAEPELNRHRIAHGRMTRSMEKID